MSFYRENPKKTRVDDNDADSLTGTIHADALSNEQINKAMETLHKDMEEKRAQNHYALNNSADFAKSWYSHE